jgi:hypothetical protein
VIGGRISAALFEAVVIGAWRSVGEQHAVTARLIVAGRS